MNQANSKVDGYLRKAGKWREALTRLRTIMLDCPLIEQVKWRHPCYMFEDRNVVILGAFKEYCLINFVKGALLKDPRRILLKPGENTQSSRVIRFTDAQQIAELEPTLKAYVQEAIAVEKAGLKVKFKKISEHKVPEELQTQLDQDTALKAAFGALTPGRQRAYILYFSAAKQSKTRHARVEKHKPRILQGKGMDD